MSTAAVRGAERDPGEQPLVRPPRASLGFGADSVLARVDRPMSDLDWRRTGLSACFPMVPPAFGPAAESEPARQSRSEPDAGPALQRAAA